MIYFSLAWRIVRESNVMFFVSEKTSNKVIVYKPVKIDLHTFNNQIRHFFHFKPSKLTYLKGHVTIIVFNQ